MSFKELLSRKSRAFALNTSGYRGDPHRYSNRFSYEDLVNAESAVGRTIFGPVPDGCQREFFEYKKNIWIWHERQLNPNGIVQEMTVRYEVRPDGVFKRPGDGPYCRIEGAELENFRNAARMYLNLIKTKLYN